MNNFWNKLLGVSFVVFCSTLMAFSNTLPDDFIGMREDSVKSTGEIEDIYFGEECTNCRYITVYDENDNLVYDKLVVDAENIQDPELKLILEKSYFLMKNSITDYYILSK